MRDLHGNRPALHHRSPLRMKSAEKESPAVGPGSHYWGRVSAPGSRWGSRLLLFDLPCRVVGDVHRSIAAGTSQCRHGYASKWLAPGDTRVFASAARDDMCATTHVWLRLVEVARIEGREDFVTVAIGQHAGTILSAITATAVWPSLATDWIIAQRL